MIFYYVLNLHIFSYWDWYTFHLNILSVMCLFKSGPIFSLNISCTYWFVGVLYVSCMVVFFRNTCCEHLLPLFGFFLRLFLRKVIFFKSINFFLLHWMKSSLYFCLKVSLICFSLPSLNLRFAWKQFLYMVWGGGPINFLKYGCQFSWQLF